VFRVEVLCKDPGLFFWLRGIKTLAVDGGELIKGCDGLACEGSHHVAPVALVSEAEV
jgi:hypothetical protein